MRSTIPYLFSMPVLLEKLVGGGLMTKIYEKLTHTNRYLNFYSAHSMSQKQGLVKCLLKRAQSQLNSKRTNKTLKTSKIMEALKKNVYSKWFLKRTVKSLKRKTNSWSANNKEFKHVLCCLIFPYTLKLCQKF